MKNIKLTLAFFWLTSLAFIACAETNIVEPMDDQQINSEFSKENIMVLPMEDISDSESESLSFMREEEKLARDVYIALYQKYNLRVFNNISKSEQTHTNAIRYLIEKYELVDPVENDIQGIFVDVHLQELYNTLIEQGNQSEIEALKVGALIEEVDILDLVKAIEESVDNEDIETVYNNLKKGSENHLRAFVKNLSSRGVTYIPQLLDPEMYSSIVN